MTSKQIKKIFLVIFVFMLFFVIPNISYAAVETGLTAAAQTSYLNTVTDATPSVFIGNKIITPLMGLVGTIFLCLMIYAGFLWMTARGDSDQVKKATTLIFDAIIGVAVILGAYAITSFVITRLG